MTLVAGTKLDPYEIIDLIGSGGMGEVWKARDTRLGRIVAIKTVKEQHGRCRSHTHRAFMIWLIERRTQR